MISFEGKDEDPHPCMPPFTVLYVIASPAAPGRDFRGGGVLLVLATVPGYLVVVRIVGITLSSFLAASAACSLGVVGAGTDLGAPIDSGGSDAPADSPLDSASCDERACNAAPAGWTVVAYVAGADAGVCPAGYGNPKAALEGPHSTQAQCTCACGAPVGNPCVKGTVSIDYRTGGTSCNDGTVTMVSDGNCNSIGGVTPGGTNAAMFHPLAGPAAPATCADNPTKPAVVFDRAGIVCTATEDAGSCAGSVCSPPLDPSLRCLRATGDIACPAAGLVKHTIGDLDDQRTCASCGCTVPSCGAASLTFYTDAACTTGATAGGTTCTALANAGAAKFGRYASTPAACTPAMISSALTGTARLTQVATICCPQ